MVKIVSGISTYNNWQGLADTLQSLNGITDYNIVVHGHYQGFDLRNPDSLFHTQEVCIRYPNTLLLDTTLIPLPQNEKRNKYIREAKDADFLLVIDDDEIVTSYKKEKFQSNLERIKESNDKPTVYTVWYLQHNGIPNDLSRILYKPGRFKYVDNHYHFAIDGKYYGATGREQIKGIILRHRKPEEIRTPEFEKAMEKYEIYQLYNEKQYHV